MDLEVNLGEYAEQDGKVGDGSSFSVPSLLFWLLTSTVLDPGSFFLIMSSFEAGCNRTHSDRYIRLFRNANTGVPGPT